METRPTVAKTSGYGMKEFMEMLFGMRKQAVHHAKIVSSLFPKAEPGTERLKVKAGLGQPRKIPFEDMDPDVEEMVRRQGKGWVTRNSSCPCGSFKRFKRCCGKFVVPGTTKKMMDEMSEAVPT